MSFFDTPSASTTTTTTTTLLQPQLQQRQLMDDLTSGLARISLAPTTRPTAKAAALPLPRNNVTRNIAAASANPRTVRLFRALNKSEMRDHATTITLEPPRTRSSGSGAACSIPRHINPLTKYCVDPDSPYISFTRDPRWVLYYAVKQAQFDGYLRTILAIDVPVDRIAFAHDQPNARDALRGDTVARSYASSASEVLVLGSLEIPTGHQFMIHLDRAPADFVAGLPADLKYTTWWMTCQRTMSLRHQRVLDSLVTSLTLFPGVIGDIKDHRCICCRDIPARGCNSSPSENSDRESSDDESGDEENSETSDAEKYDDDKEGYNDLCVLCSKCHECGAFGFKRYLIASSPRGHLLFCQACASCSWCGQVADCDDDDGVLGLSHVSLDHEDPKPMCDDCILLHTACDGCDKLISDSLVEVMMDDPDDVALWCDYCCSKNSWECQMCDGLVATNNGAAFDVDGCKVCPACAKCNECGAVDQSDAKQCTNCSEFTCGDHGDDILDPMSEKFGREDYDWVCDKCRRYSLDDYDDYDYGDLQEVHFTRHVGEKEKTEGHSNIVNVDREHGNVTILDTSSEIPKSFAFGLSGVTATGFVSIGAEEDYSPSQLIIPL
ncbi:hypothetical protein HDU81_010871 [Chytriomyces hyalinus]|nr:hypothetical protein HDU81_010871 [Chytriomyces hyalinus]